MRKAQIEHLAAKMKQLKKTKEGGTILFLGAGASVTAGIPTANGLINEIKRKKAFKAQIETNKPESYDQYMACLSSKDRKQLFKKHVDKAKVNATHLYAAQLIAEGYIDIVVTTNFDPLIIKALHLFNVIPFTYDISIVDKGIITEFDKPSVIFLHGQSHGFRQLNTEQELQLPREAIRDTFMKISQNHSWIVLGYSGSDPVFDILCSIDNFQENLYWICYSHFKPSEHVRKRLLDIETKGTLFIEGFDSDEFFKKLKNCCGLSVPEIIQKPFTTVLRISENLIEPHGLDLGKIESLAIRRKHIRNAIAIFESPFEPTPPDITKNDLIKDEITIQLQGIISNEKFSDLEAIHETCDQNQQIVGSSYLINFYLGFAYLMYAKEQKAAFKLETLEKSIDFFSKSLEINEKYAPTFYNLAWAYHYLAELAPTVERRVEIMWSPIYYNIKALEINPKMYRARCNLAFAFSDLALFDMKSGRKIEHISNAIEQFDLAINTNPREVWAYYGIGTVINNLTTTHKELPKEVFLTAQKAYKRAARYNLSSIELYSRWGDLYYYYALYAPSNTINPETYLKKAIEKYEINDRDSTFSNNNTALIRWGKALLRLSQKEKNQNSKNYGKQAINKFIQFKSRIQGHKSIDTTLATAYLSLKDYHSYFRTLEDVFKKAPRDFKELRVRLEAFKNNTHNQDLDMKVLDQLEGFINETQTILNNKPEISQPKGLEKFIKDQASI